MTRKSETPSPIRVQKYLGGLDYPVGKEDILDRARKQGADDETLHMLEQLPDQEYSSPIAISREVGKLH
jgi:hypothetical protein